MFQLKHCYLVLIKTSLQLWETFLWILFFPPKIFSKYESVYYLYTTSLDINLSLKEIALQTSVSSSTVNRILNSIFYSLQKLLELVSIDKFKRNATISKYQCILVDPLKHKILDLLPNRTQNYLVSYFLISYLKRNIIV